MRNKRNYYRILHVQFDAPPAVIKASYRAIMQKLRAHPDLGGENWNASLINEAKDVLLDPVLRAEYDLQQSRAPHQTTQSSEKEQGAADLGGRPNNAPSTPYTAENDSGNCAGGSEFSSIKLTSDTTIANPNSPCPFCHNLASQKPPELLAYPTAHRCTHCNAPLKMVHKPWLDNRDEMRKVNRSELEQPVRVWDKWPRDTGFGANVFDWSTAGCCIQMNHTLEIDSTILVLSPIFDAIAIVRYKSEHLFYGLEFLTLEVKMKPGSLFVSAA